MFAVNEGMLDRAIRMAIGIALVALAEVGMIGAWGWIGIVPLVTGLVGTCPLYRLLGIRTCTIKPAE
jgi:hypothetical protein